MLGEMIWHVNEDEKPYMSYDLPDGEWEFSAPCLCTDGKGNYEVLYYIATEKEAYWYNFGMRSESCMIVTHWQYINKLDTFEPSVVY